MHRNEDETEYDDIYYDFTERYCSACGRAIAPDEKLRYFIYEGPKYNKHKRIYVCEDCKNEGYEVFNIR